MNNTSNNNNSAELQTVVSTSGSKSKRQAQKLDLGHVDYLMSNPDLLVDMLPKAQRESMAENVGRGSRASGLANPRLRSRR